MNLHLSIGHGRVVSATLVNRALEGRVVSANWCMEQQSGGCTHCRSVGLTVVLSHWYEPLH